jgi:endogenous inhibitor of DNA gyrase (YacG/DUF329 family)
VPVDVCVFCRRQPADVRWRPFCSQRCQIQDLARWADGRYTVPVEDATEPDESQKEKGKSWK